MARREKCACAMRKKGYCKCNETSMVSFQPVFVFDNLHLTYLFRRCIIELCRDYHFLLYFAGRIVMEGAQPGERKYKLPEDQVEMYTERFVSIGMNLPRARVCAREREREREKIKKRVVLGGGRASEQERVCVYVRPCVCARACVCVCVCLCV